MAKPSVSKAAKAASEADGKQCAVKLIYSLLDAGWKRPTRTAAMLNGMRNFASMNTADQRKFAGVIADFLHGGLVGANFNIETYATKKRTAPQAREVSHVN